MRQFGLIDRTGTRESFRWPMADAAGAAGTDFGIVNIHGHSWSDNKMGLGRRIGALLNLEPPNIRHHGIGGSQLLNMAGYNYQVAGWGKVQRAVRPNHLPRNATAPIPYVSTAGAHIFIFTTVNDVNVWGDPTINGGQLLEAYKGAWRASLARCRAGYVFDAFDPAVTVNTGTWTSEATILNPAGGAAVPNIYTSGGLLRVSTVAGAKLNLAVPSDYQGGFINVRLIGENGAGCATATIAGAGITPVTASTSSVMPANSYLGAGIKSLGVVNKRIALAETGTVQTLTLTNTSGGRLAFSCFEIEDLNPPPCVALLSPRIFAWPGSPFTSGAPSGVRAGGTGAQPGDAMSTAFDAATVSVFAEFTGPVATVDVNALLDGTVHPELWYDALHPNEYAAELIADAVVSKLNTLTVSGPARALEHA